MKISPKHIAAAREAQAATAWDAAQPDPRKPWRPWKENEPADAVIQSRTSMRRKNHYVRFAQAKKKNLTTWMFDELDRVSKFDPAAPARK